MTIGEFLHQNHDARFIAGNSHYSVYRRDIYQFGGPTIAKFFYFEDEKLKAIDEGQRVPDITVQINSTN